MRATAHSLQAIKAAEADAEAIRKAGEAQAAVVRAMGLAEADRMRKKAEAWKNYSEAAYLEMLIKRLPELTAEIARPLRNTNKVVIVGSSNDAGSAEGGGSRTSDDFVRNLAQLPTVVQALTGLDVADALRRIASGGHLGGLGGLGAGQPSTNAPAGAAAAASLTAAP